MVSIVGGNASKISHFDLGPDGGAKTGLSNSQASDFFDLISMLNISFDASEKKLNDLELKPFSNNLLIGQGEGHLGPANLSEGININGSTLSQLSSIRALPESKIEDQLRELLSEIQLDLDKLQIANEYSAIKRSQVIAGDPTEAFLSLFEVESSNKGKTNNISDYLQAISVSENLEPGLSLKKLSNDTSLSSRLIKSLPFENGDSGSLLLDLSNLKLDDPTTSELVLLSNLYISPEKLNNEHINNHPKKLEELFLDLEISSKLVTAEISDLSNKNFRIPKEKSPLNSDTEFSVITVDVPNRNLTALNLRITLETSNNFVMPNTYVVLKFDGTLNSQNFSQQRVDLLKSQHGPFIGETSKTIAEPLIGINPELKDFAIDDTQLVHTFKSNSENNYLVKNSEVILSRLAAEPSSTLIDKVDLSEASSLGLAKIIKDRLQAVLSSETRKLNFKKEISSFVEASKGNLIIGEIAKKLVKKEFGLNESISPKKELLLSSADVLGYREIISSKFDKPSFIFQEYGKDSFKTDKVSTELRLGSLEETHTTQNPKSVMTGIQKSEQNISRSDVSLDRSSNIQSQTFSQRISLLESQFSSRLANALLEQAVNSRESFDLILEPETFGKVRVNVQIDSSQIDVRLTAENSSTLAILRASESILHNISEQNGLKLAEYNVEMNNNAQNNAGSNEKNRQENQSDKLNSDVEKLEEIPDSFDENDHSHSLNLIA